MHPENQSYSLSRVFTTLILVLFFIPIQAQDKGSYSGIVKNRETGDPLSGASVYSLTDNKGTTTNRLGQWKINLLPGPQSLVTSHLGFKNDTLISPDNNSGLPFTILLSQDMVAIPEARILGQADTWSLATLAPGQIRLSMT
ncbi:MAG: carboxypeptidase-like regulatory domain-containing protein, partial [Bacteroidales bacterium]